ncbi:hypothetical protein ABPG75_001003 [Micractinium tetrahymenae]
MALPPPAPGFIAPPTFQVALDWTEEEQRALEAGLQRYPPEHFDLVQRYVKIAAMLPRKSVRDVALRARWTINQQLLKKRKPGELPPGAAAAGAKKPLGMAGGLLPPKAPQIPPVPMMSGMPSMPAAAAVPADSATNAVIGGPIAQLLEQNFAILNEFRSNMTDFKVHENTQLLVQFRDNILAIINAMEAMGGVMAQMPQLPVRLNVDLANNFLPSRPASMPAYNLAMPPPQPALNAPGMVPLHDDGGPGSGAVPQQQQHGGGGGAGGGGLPLPASSMPFMGGSFGGAPVILKKQEG